MKYSLDTKMKFLPMLMYGLQWWVVAVPSIIVMGLVVAKLHFGADIEVQTLYMQKLFGVIGLSLVIQIVWGHRLPLVIGPASVLLIGILASVSSGVPAIYTAVLVGGVIISVIAFTGLLGRLQSIFTPRIITVILLLVAITLAPVIITLVFSGNASTLFTISFVFIFVIALIVANNLLRGVWKSTTLVWGIAGGTIVYFLFNGFPEVETVTYSGQMKELSFFFVPEFNGGVILSFVFCVITLIVNELGSIQAVGHMLEAGSMAKRTTRGIGVTGLMNVLAGSIGVIGPVDYSTSPGIIAASGCASRYPLIPAGLGMIVCAFLPSVVSSLLYIPGAVMGTLLLYIMSSQLAASMQLLVKDKAASDFRGGLIIGLPVMSTLLISFAPAQAMEQIPSLVRPILGNGFVMGVGVVFIMEHLIFRKSE